MRLFGFTITRQPPAEKASDLITRYPVGAQGGTFGSGPFGALFGTMMGRIRESFTGAWQRNVELSVPDAMTHGTVWACVTLIASDVAKCWVQLVEEVEDDVCLPIENPAYSPVLRKPNHYQTTYQFFLYWVLSLLTRGNTFVLKERNNRGGLEQGNVIALHVLDPTRVQVLVSPTGDVFYQLNTDNLSGITQQSVTIPASEIIHDRMYPLYHPLIGVGPLTAAWLTALQGMRIQQQSENFFANHAQPGGLLLTPNTITNEAAKSLKASWEHQFSGPDASGQVAVLGGGMTYTSLVPMTAEASQLVEQLKWGDERICSCFHVPPWKVGVAPMPAYGNPQALEIIYHAAALQGPMESIEQLMTEGLELATGLSIEFDTDALFRMDTATLVTSTRDAVKGTLLTPNEGRARLNYPSVTGGDAVLSQQQDFSIEALAERDANKPFAKPDPAPAPPPDAAMTPAPDPTSAADEAKDFDLMTFELALRVKALDEGLPYAA
jgi:HK97 family phage portal protein